jgi:hypothetical protein
MTIYLPYEIKYIIYSFLNSKCIMCDKQINIFNIQTWGNKYVCSLCKENLELLML